MTDRKDSVNDNRPEAEYSYSAYGLIFSSMLALPELVAVASSNPPDVVIRRWSAPPRLDPAVAQHALSVRVAGDAIHYAWKHYGQFLLRGGREILYAPVPGAAERTVRAPLLGVVIGTLLHQRRVFTLHASAVAVGGGVVAFVGPKRAGKSTTSAALHQRGYALVTDDVLAVDVAPGQAPQVRPAFPHIKLCPDAVAALGHEPAAFPRLHAKLDKRMYAASSGFVHSPVPLRCIYVLDEGEALAATPLSQKEGFFQLLSHSYAARFIGAEGAGRAHFFQSQALAKAVPMYRLYRPKALSKLSAFADFVEAHLAADATPERNEDLEAPTRDAYTPYLEEA